MECLLEKREKYGNVLYYPANETAVLLAKLAGDKTLTKESQAIIKKLGFEVKLKQEEI